MIWLTWRRFRSQAFVAVAALASILVVLAISNSHVATIYSASGSHDLTGIYVWIRLLGTVLIGVPAAIGAFWGAPLVAQEIESHTHRLAWTQSVTRQRWLLSKLLVIGAVSAATVGVFTVAFTRWSAPIDATGNRIGTANFAQRGVVPLGYAVFSLALGSLMGAVIRRTLPAMAATLATFFATRLFVQLLVRPHLVSAIEVSTATFGTDPSSGWVLTSRTVDAAGNTVVGVESQLVNACNLTRTDFETALAACAKTHGIHDVVRVHPASHFWMLQTYELGIFLALALATTAVCLWWIRTRAA